MKKILLQGYYKMLAILAKKYLRKHRIFVIGINGSVGKTSCRVVIHQTLQKFLPQKKIYTSSENFNGELGLSLSVFQREKWLPNIFFLIKTFFHIICKTFFGAKPYDIILLEYGIDRPGEMDFLLSIAKPDIGVLTALDSVHSEQFGDPGAIAREEIKLPLHTKEIVFLNNDEPYTRELKSMINVDKIIYQTQAYVSTTDISFQKESLVYDNNNVHSKFSLDMRKKQFIVQSNLLAKVNYGYVGVALCIAEVMYYKFYHKEIFASHNKLTLDYELIPGRLSVFSGVHNSLIIDSSYNSSPLSVRMLTSLANTMRQQLFPSRELWFVLGDMRELGIFTESEHRKLATYVSMADRVFTVGESMNTYLADELKKIGYHKPVELYLSSEKLGKYLKSELKKNKGEVLFMVKGSQNTIFLEETVKALLLDKNDIKKLTRQSNWWIKKKNSFFEKPHH